MTTTNDRTANANEITSPYESFLYERLRKSEELARRYILECAADDEPELVRLAIRNVIAALGGTAND